jgi:hypothetical protein
LVARLRADELDAANAELASAGFPNPKVRNFNGAPLDKLSLEKPIDVLMDVEPRKEETMALAGVAIDQHPIMGQMLAQVLTDGKPVASDPLPLLRPDGPMGLVLAAPVLQQGNPQPVGFVTFSYELAPLMLANDDLSLFSVVLKDPRSDDGELIANDRGIVTSRTVNRQGPAPSVTRAVTFGGRDWTLGYYAKTNALVRAQQTGTIVAQP